MKFKLTVFREFFSMVNERETVDYLKQLGFKFYDYTEGHILIRKNESFDPEIEIKDLEELVEFSKDANGIELYESIIVENGKTQDVMWIRVLTWLDDE